MAERMAADLRLPIIRIIEGSGGGGSVKTIETTGRANLPGGIGWQVVCHLQRQHRRVPVVGLGLGSVAGLGAARLAATHYSVMTKETSAMFVAGPPVVNALGDKQFDKQELGGWEIQCAAGAHRPCGGQRGGGLRRGAALPLLPARPRPGGAGARTARGRPGRGARSRWFDAIPRDLRKPYQMRPIIEKVVDRGSFFEMGRHFGRSVVTGLARLNGWPVAVHGGRPDVLCRRPGRPMPARR